VNVPDPERQLEGQAPDTVGKLRHPPEGRSRCSPRRRERITSRNVRPAQLAGTRHTSAVPKSEKM
jgi:hypothetical protein